MKLLELLHRDPTFCESLFSDLGWGPSRLFPGSRILIKLAKARSFACFHLEIPQFSEQALPPTPDLDLPPFAVI